ncbi:uncharacterized protein SCHCODRAFT_02615607 [Schizophyllum commune H4-8]|uniref:Uncharacterized protein n=1 Tax=Schizophyllum commune (strain H4-8 / FGSC 9210) TaxID=578458 RepID=D8Q097_SCHCM|nr:uncharacterized protein SCHCODRAFT_02615607 [Schizophyllum commune H4-8]KAI5896705.1 hypothetical protein SCHCODRAFT_02615607 [Schizophyllum commune H4-8]
MLFTTLIPLSLAALAAATGGPAIEKPAANSVIQPGEEFDFHYYSMADYLRTGYNTSIFLFTSEIGALASGGQNESVTTGHFFGRWSTGSVPNNNHPVEALPEKLTMPDFSVNPGGFGIGKTASDAPMFLAVFEEWAEQSGSVGHKIAYVSTPIIYNGTKSS